MQTFLPYPSFAESAHVLDRQRLGKQRVENLQIMQTLLHCRVETRDAGGNELPRERWRVVPNSRPGWVSHPAVEMWKTFELHLLLYQVAIVSEWEARGYKDTCLAKTAMVYQFNHQHVTNAPASPPWLGDELLHISHQSNLVRKDPAHYGPIFECVPDDIPYMWPTREE
jgi:hypothetical protein